MLNKKFSRWLKEKQVYNNTSMLITVIILIIVFISGMIIQEQQSYEDGYNRALLEQEKQDDYEEWLSYSFETQKESFLSVIMFEVADNIHKIFMFFAVFLMVWALGRWFN